MALTTEARVDLSRLRREALEVFQVVENIFSLLEGGQNTEIGFSDAAFELRNTAIEAERLDRVLQQMTDNDVTVAVSVDGEEEITETVEQVQRLDEIDPTVEISSEGLDELGLGLGQVSLDADELVSKLSDQLPAGARSAVNALLAVNPALAAFAASLAAVAVVGAQYQAAQNEIQIATGATGEALQGLTESAARVASEVPASLQAAAEQVGVLNTFLGSSGAELEGLAEGVLDVSRLLGEDATSNAQNFAQVLNLFGESAEDGVERLDLLFAATQRYGVGLGSLLGTLETSGGVFQAVGLNLEESVNLIGQFNLAGLGAGEATAALTQLIARAEDSGRTFNEALLDLQSSIQTAATEQEAFNIGIEAFGTRSGVAFSQAIRSGIIDLNDLEGALGATAGLVAQTAADTETAGQALREAFNGLVDGIAPLGEGVIVAVTGITSALAGLPDGVAQLGALTAAAGAATLAFGPLGAAAVAGFGALSLILGDQADQARQAAERADRFTEALIEAGDQSVSHTVDIGALADAYNGLAGAVEPATTEIAEFSTSSAAFSAVLGDLSESTRVLFGRFVEAGGDIDTAFDAIRSGSDIFEAIQNVAENSSRSVESLTGRLIELAEQSGNPDLVAAAEQIGEFATQSDLSRQELAALLDAFDETADASDDMRRELEALTLQDEAVTDTTSEFGREVARLAAELREAGNDIDPYTAAVRRLDETYGDLVVTIDEASFAVGGSSAAQAAGLARQQQQAAAAAQAIDLMAQRYQAIGEQQFDLIVNAELETERIRSGIADARQIADAVFGDPFRISLEPDQASLADAANQLAQRLQERASFAANQFVIENSGLLSAAQQELFNQLIAGGGAQAASWVQQLRDAIVNEDNELIATLTEALNSGIEALDLEEVWQEKAAEIEDQDPARIPARFDIDDSELRRERIAAITAILEVEDPGDIPIGLDIDDSELDRIRQRTIAAQVSLGVDTAALDELSDEELELLARIAGVDDQLVDQVTSQTRNIDVELVPFIDQAELDRIAAAIEEAFRTGIPQPLAAGGAFDSSGAQFMRHGGFIANNPGAGVPFSYAGRAFVAGEDPRGPENVEFGPGGMSVVGAYHPARLTLDRLAATGVLDKIEPLLADRFAANAGQVDAAGRVEAAPVLFDVSVRAAEWMSAVSSTDELGKISAGFDRLNQKVDRLVAASEDAALSGSQIQANTRRNAEIVDAVEVNTRRGVSGGSRSARDAGLWP